MEKVEKVKKTVIVLAVVMFFAAISMAEAQMNVTIGLINQNGGILQDNAAVQVGTAVNVTGHYENSHGYNAVALVQVYYSINNITFVEKISARRIVIVRNGRDVNVGPFPLTDIGYYQFRITYTEIPLSGGTGLVRCPATRQLRARLYNVTPEPGPLIGVSLGVVVLGLFFVRKKNSRLKLS